MLTNCNHPIVTKYDKKVKRELHFYLIVLFKMYLIYSNAFTFTQVDIHV